MSGWAGERVSTTGARAPGALVRPPPWAVARGQSTTAPGSSAVAPHPSAVARGRSDVTPGKSTATPRQLAAARGQ